MFIYFFYSLFVAIAIEAFNKLGTLDEDQPQLRPHIERQASDQYQFRTTSDVRQFCIRNKLFVYRNLTCSPSLPTPLSLSVLKQFAGGSCILLAAWCRKKPGKALRAGVGDHLVSKLTCRFHESLPIGLNEASSCPHDQQRGQQFIRKC